MTRLASILTLFLAISFCGESFAQIRKYSNEFLNIGAGAQSLGRSKAVVATIDDNTANYWNPAGLLGVQSDLQVSAMHAEYFAGIAKYDYFSVATGLKDKGALAVGIMRFGIDDIPNTIDLIDSEGNLDYDRIETFSAADYAFLLSYARKLKIEGLRFGANAKIIYRNVGSFAHAWGFGLDAGLQYKKGNWDFGLMGRDITSTYNAWTYTLDDRTIEVFQITGNEIPQNGLEITLPRLVLGAAHTFDIKEKFGIVAELDLVTTFDGQRSTVITSNSVSVDPYFGIEADYKKLVFLRGGLGNFQQVKAQIGQQDVTSFQPNIGIGVRIKRVYLDYALTDIGDQSVSLYSNVFSLKIDFVKSEKE